MDTIKLAELLFPEVDVTVEEIINVYPKRILPVGAEVTRIAPSPTGYLHIGHIYGAFIDKLIAYHSNGVFYMRLEDTDAKREVANSGDIAYNMLSYFGLKPDEGYMGSNKEQIGKYGSYVQSERTKIYCAFAKRLVELGNAYPCFCTGAQNKDEILKRRQEQLEQNNDIEEKDPCRNLTQEEIEENLKQGKPFAIRLKSTGDPNKTFKIKDEIKGEREVRENTKDIIILKSNKTPPYSFAHAVDDTLMGTTTVVRGEEWFPSWSSHIELFEKLGLPHPKYAHNPVICKLDESGNKRKLSKRKDKEADARYFVEQGYPVTSVMEYLLNLINSDFEDWRKQNPTASYYDFPFKVSKIGSNNPMFDFNKLDDCSKQVISHFSNEDIYENALSWAKDYNKDFFEVLQSKKDFCLSLFSVDRTGSNPRKDIAKWSDIPNLYFYMFNNLNNLKLNNYELYDNISKQDTINLLNAYKEVYSAADDKQTWFNNIKGICQTLGFCDNIKEYKKNPEAYKGSVADVSGIIRVAITTKKNTPDLFELMKLLGEKEVAERINHFISLLAK